MDDKTRTRVAEMRGEGVANDLKYFSALNDLPCLVSVPFEECFALILVTHHGQKLPSIAQLIECYAVIPLHAFLTAAYHLLYHIQVKGQRPREWKKWLRVHQRSATCPATYLSLRVPCTAPSEHHHHQYIYLHVIYKCEVRQQQNAKSLELRA